MALEIIKQMRGFGERIDFPEHLDTNEENLEETFVNWVSVSEHKMNENYQGQWNIFQVWCNLQENYNCNGEIPSLGSAFLQATKSYGVS
ncbi:hypothetical protein C5167_043194 [Papaver somniferum]|uniref:Uncharacterized protein n=1 Tax=Papaver somniferum TaxID=3469 RepID=A0A4Y7L4Z7_PAPSO|nr:hypothetical protein C5167_043194 [Papaver somniferum]